MADTNTLHQLPKPETRKTGWPWTVATPPLPDAPGGGLIWPKITVITPSYNQGQYIEETIRSVLLQNYPHLEYVIMDGGSTDDTVKVIEKYSEFITHWVSEEDAGQTHAINKGLKQCTGEIVGWLNSDDILLPNALRHIAEAFLSDPQAMVVTGFRKNMDADSHITGNQFHSPPEAKYLRIVDNVPQEATYWRRELLDTVGYLDESFKYAMDYDYWHRILDAGYTFTLIPHYLGGFRFHKASKGSQMAETRAEELARIYRSRGLGESEEAAFEKLNQVMGSNWHEKEKFMEMLCRRPLSDDPRMLLLAFRVLEMPLLSHIITGVYQAYVDTRTNRRPDE